jgi:hypothetical protein
MTHRYRASRDDVTRLRLQRHGLVGEPLPSPVAAVERMLAVQAQDYTAGKWALGIRSPGTTIGDVDAAINSGRIVRSWPMRGTLHFVPARELNWMLALTTPRLLVGTKTRQAQLDLDAGIIEQARAVAVDALEGGRELSRADFLQVLEEKGIATRAQRGYHLIWHLAQSGTLCWGRQVGKAQVLVLMNEWVPQPRCLEPDEALGEFVFRYFAGHGPATLKDFAWWSQLTIADAKTGLAVAAPRLAELDVDGTTMYLSTDAGELGNPVRQRSPVLALPGFDEYLLGYRDRTFAIDEEDLRRVVPGKNGIFLPLMVADGRVIGTWRRTAKPGKISVEAQPLGGPKAPAFNARRQAGFRRSVRDYSRFLGMTASVVPKLDDTTAPDVVPKRDNMTAPDVVAVPDATVTLA